MANVNFNPTYAERQKALAGGGANPGKPFEVYVKTLKDTILLNGATALTPTTIFVSSAKDPQYQDGYFPMPSYLRNVKQVAVKTNLQFSGTAITNPFLMQNFIENSYISITLQKQEVYKAWLWQCTTFNMSPVVASVPAGAPVDRQDLFLRFNDIVPPVQVGAGADCIVRFVPASGLTTATSGAGTPVLPNSGLTASTGYSIGVYLVVDEWQAAN